jgi:electron transfer flavoprotein-quinone oxidoreductase
MKGAVNPDSMAVGVKEVLEFGEKEIEKRFGLNAGEGLAWLSAGDSTGGVLGGGFLYTNRTTVSCGIVATLSEAGKSPYSVPEMLEHFKHSAGIEPLVSGGRLLEYSAHLVPEGGYKELPELFRSGVLLAGDAAGMVINLGIMVRGMDFAIESGRLAAQAVLEAKGDYSWQKLQRYRELLDESFVLRDMKKYQRVPEFLSSPRIFTAYPRMAEEILSAVFRVDGSKPVPMVLKAVPPVLRSGIPGLVKDAWKGVTSL